jgi:serine/threonine-protein kinase
LATEPGLVRTLSSVQDAPHAATPASRIQRIDERADSRTEAAPERTSDSEKEAAHVPAPSAAIELFGARSGPEPADRYERVELLGAGGMGEVALCRDRWIGRDVAKKTMHASRAPSAEARERFAREMRVQGQLEHPAIVPVYDFGTDADGHLYFTMRRVRGVTLKRVLEALAGGDAETTARYSRRKLLTAFVSVILAVHYAHTRGVLHRDLKPSNIMLGELGEVYVLDWGIAKLVEGAAPPGSPLTHHGAIVGTPPYMAPEQLLRKPELDARTDIYALGTILFEILALRPLHQGRDTPEILEVTLEGLDTRPSALVPNVPPELDAACVRATERDPDRRFESAQAMAEAIERYLDGDRDLERRRSLAAEHATRAREAAARDGDAGRADAMREVVKALAFDPTEPVATRTLVDLMVNVPATLPAEAEVEMEQASLRSREENVKHAFLGALGWASFIPAGLLLGVRSWASYGVSIAAVAASVLYALWMWRAKAFASKHAYTLAILEAVTVMSTSTWLGPFINIPMCAAVVSLMFVTSAKRRERPGLVLIWTLVNLIPLALEALHVLPPSFAFEGDRLVLLARGYHFPAGTTIALLLWVGVTWTVFPTLFVARLRDALSRAERELFLHAWHFRQILRAGPMDGGQRPGHLSTARP